MPSRVHYGGDEALEARVDSLESGDAWDGKSEGYVPTVQADDSIMWAPGGGGGGGADLSAVDEDITVLNNHKINLIAGTNPLFVVSIENEFDRLTITGSEDDESTTVRVRDPLNPADNYLAITVEDGETSLSLVQANERDGGVHLGSGSVSVQPDKPNTIMTGCSFEFLSGGTVVLQASDNSQHRLIVAPDGSLSTEPVV
jgi:hypothetical protein